MNSTKLKNEGSNKQVALTCWLMQPALARILIDMPGMTAKAPNDITQPRG